MFGSSLLVTRSQIGRASGCCCGDQPAPSGDGDGRDVYSGDIYQLPLYHHNNSTLDPLFSLPSSRVISERTPMMAGARLAFSLHLL
jgi:hypothetical protein